MNMNPMLPGDDRPLPGDLQELLRSYRDSFDGIDASTGFMPGLWAKIDSRRKVAYSFGRLASAFVTAAFLICLVLSGTLLSLNYQQNGPSQSSYIDALAADSAGEDFEIVLASAERP
jgi:hypothetical protein